MQALRKLSADDLRSLLRRGQRPVPFTGFQHGIIIFPENPVVKGENQGLPMEGLPVGGIVWDGGIDQIFQLVVVEKLKLPGVLHPKGTAGVESIG